MAAKEKFRFEDSLAELEKLVVKMEEGDLSLEESLAAFEEGMRLTRECQEALAAAEQKVSILTAKGDQQPFDANDRGSD